MISLVFLYFNLLWHWWIYSVEIWCQRNKVNKYFNCLLSIFIHFPDLFPQNICKVLFIYYIYRKCKRNWYSNTIGPKTTFSHQKKYRFRTKILSINQRSVWLGCSDLDLAPNKHFLAPNFQHQKWTFQHQK